MPGTCTSSVAVLALAAVPLSCARAHGPAVLALTSFRQESQSGVLLNETLVLHFDRDIDPASVTRRSMRVVGPGGRVARGRFEVERDQVRFLPEPPRSGDLSDGGLLPGSEHLLEVAGFPLPDAVRAVDGAPLRATLRAGFATVAADSPRVFEDSIASSRRRLLVPPEGAIAPLEGIRLTSEVPLDPASLRAQDFTLVRGGHAGGELQPIPLEARLAENHEDGAVVQLLPRHPNGAPRSLAPGEYQLLFDVNAFALRDLGGRPVRPAWWGGAPWATIVVEVEPRAPRYREEFLDPGAASPEASLGFDGTAHWADSGAARVRFPLSAGDGGDGEMLLVGETLEHDVHAVRLTVPAGEAAHLPPFGLVVLRSQGRLDVHGRLVRTVESGAAARLPGEAVEAWLERVRLARARFAVPAMEPAFGLALESVIGPRLESTGEFRESLAAFLDRAADADPAWTVLVAGGDLDVTGEVVLDGPLLLAAGGRIRVSGRVEAREVFKVREGGGVILPWVSEAPLVFAAPEHNPLVEPLRLAVLSAPIVPPRGIARWRGADWSGRAGGGSIDVTFVGERLRPSGGVEVSAPVEDPGLLDGYEAVRFRVELTAWPGGPWDPPFVDHVELRWVEPEGGG